ncbi:FAD-dependent oxidoreductase [Marinospirillum sp. MEB164]|uniref:FAD-dependent oxidoreductase n=1 Tax=Marinospirillum alkalitolerans TaxID=3123374 RepID=A0ABW8Q164_9GAMM
MNKQQTAAPRVAVIGAGMAGVICAERLQAAGWSVTLMDKARGTGGRLSSRRLEGVPFDLGAQVIQAQHADFVAQLAEWEDKGWVLPWPEEQGWCAVPRMSGLTRQISAGVPFEPSCRIVRIERVEQTWRLEDDQQRLWSDFDHLVLALPAPQAAVLLEKVAPAWAAQAASIALQPCWTAYFRLDPSAALPAVSSLPRATPLAQTTPSPDAGELGLRRWTCQTAKPSWRESTDAALWVVEANAAWSAAHLETPPAQVAEALFDLWKQVVGQPQLTRPVHLAAHRWLYALTASVCASPYWSSSVHEVEVAAGLHLCGDYFQRTGVEGAYLSGRALAEALIDAQQG